MTEFRVVTTGLNFPEGPIALPDGDLLVVEVAAGVLTRVAPDGRRAMAAKTGGGPNGAAIGPDGACYICNNGGIKVRRVDGLTLPEDTPQDTPPGSIQRVDLASGKVEVLYAHGAATPFWGPNDLVFDDAGGFWFSDFGRISGRTQYVGSLYYAKADGSRIEEVVHPLITPNGVGLSPNGQFLYVAETFTSQVIRFELAAPGVIKRAATRNGGTVIGRAGRDQYLDSLAVDCAGNVCVACPGSGGICCFAADGSVQRHVPLPDFMTTNICFGGPGLRTAYITLASTGQLVAMPWPQAGTPLNYLNR